MRELRRRARLASAKQYLVKPNEEPRWLAALPPVEARLARTMLEATREMAMRLAEAPMNGDVEHATAARIAAAVPEPELAVVGAGRPKRRSSGRGQR
jgi:hypothetical protein